MLLLIVQVSNFNFCEDFFFLRLCFEFMVDGWECWLKLTLMFKEVCGHLITLTTALVVLPYLRFILLGSEEETQTPTLKNSWSYNWWVSNLRFVVIAPQKPEVKHTEFK